MEFLASARNDKERGRMKVFRDEEDEMFRQVDTLIENHPPNYDYWNGLIRECVGLAPL